ncbi:MAG TPA: DNA ligase D [Candidatus Limnocylindrales bacterium]|nr:DNA ligase D [Candidatus Limnocylindrales bacterium]
MTPRQPLAEYRRKRNFGRTPEPAGAPDTTPTAASRGRFVVQRHRATRLHYDFRLEIGGVLVSWAVPRGPSLDPKARRMAVHVEDHPIEYLDFEGVIPKGQYGAGDVIVWDWGTWHAEAETPDGERAVTDGELKFVLEGQKLGGRFTIVRTSGRGRGSAGRGDEPGARAFEDDEAEQWLLIHKRDEHAVAGWDAEDHPTSVKTGRTNDEVKENRDAIWVSEAPAAAARIDLANAIPAPMPGFIEPMAATLADKGFRDEDWLFEVKWDGYRLQAVVRDGKVRTFTRNGKDGDTYFPRLLSPPTWIDAREAIVDGEVVAVDDDGMPSFPLLQERLGVKGPNGGAAPGLLYQAFDILYHDGRSLLRVPLEDRKRLLRSVLRDDRRVRFASHVETEGVAFLEACAKQGLEGAIAKHRRSTYEPGTRSRAWLKLKIRPEQELVVGGWTAGEGNAKDLGALVVGYYEADGDSPDAPRRLHFAGKVGAGFTGKTRLELRRRLAELETPKPPFDPPPPKDYRGRWGGDLARVTWVRPEIVIRAELGGWTRDGIVRQAAYKGLEPGKDPLEVTRERAVEARATVEAVEAEIPASAPRPTPTAAEPAHLHPWTATDEELEALARLGKEGTWRVGGEDLKLTNLDKPLFPPRDGDDGGPITKRELVGYFARIAPVMLPHLAERPLNLHRFPNGPDGPGFWQKDLKPTDPAWLRRWREVGVEARDANDHLVADRVATLCWLGNQAAFEIHAWTSRLDAPFRPTFALVDIDPGTKTTWDETLVLARLFRTALEHLGVRGYPKVTGQRGVQVWIPIVPKYDHGQTTDWVEKLSRAVGAVVPDLVSWKWSKKDRDGRARLDYTQNEPIKTLVAPYAVRPAAGAPVSAPIAWDELDDPELRPNHWTIRNLLDRVATVGDLFAAAQTDAQELPPV